MDTPREAIPTAVTPAPVGPGQSSCASWPRPVQITLAALLALGLLAVAGKSLLQALETGPSVVPSQRIDLNWATLGELILLPGVGDQLAARILKVRDKRRFLNVDELRQVPGMGPATLERIRPLVYVAAYSRTADPEPRLPLTVEPSTKRGAKSKKAANLKEPIDANTATAAELMQLPGIGPKLSQRIVDERTKKRFEAVSDLRRMHGIGPKILEKIRPYLRVTRGDDAQAYNNR